MKKKLVLLLLISIVVIGIIVGIMIIPKNKEKGAKQDSNWGDVYYAYIKEIKPSDNSKIMFYESTLSDDPVMAVYDDSKKDANSDVGFSISLYKIENDEVKNMSNNIYGNEAEIRFGYDVEKGKYNYFMYSNTEDSETYESLDSIVIEAIVSDELTKEGLTGTERSEKEKEKLSKYDNYAKYFKVTNEKSTAYKDIYYVINTDYKFNYILYKNDEKYLKKEFSKSIKSYQKNNDIGLKFDSLIEKNKNKEEIKDTKKVEDVIKAGDYTLKYGTYKSSISSYMEEFGGEYTIKPDGTFTYVNNWTDTNGNTYTNNAEGTYKVEYANMKEMDEMPDDYKWVITFTATSYSGKGRFTDSPIPNDQYYNVDSYDITDNNKFQASQYENIWTLKD